MKQRYQMRTEVQRKLPGVQRGRARNTLHPSEDVVQKQIESALRLKGYKVMSTVHRHKRQKCPRCNAQFWQQGGYGATKGVPDLLVSHLSWPKAAFLGVEVKGHSTPLSPEQKHLVAEKRIVIVRGVADALEAVEAFETWLDETSALAMVEGFQAWLLAQSKIAKSSKATSTAKALFEQWLDEKAGDGDTDGGSANGEHGD